MPGAVDVCVAAVTVDGERGRACDAREGICDDSRGRDADAHIISAAVSGGGGGRCVCVAAVDRTGKAVVALTISERKKSICERWA